MKKQNVKQLHRRSIRLKDYDYSQNGAYFVTVCTQNKQHLFGEVKDEKMFLSEAGEMTGKWWMEIKNKFKNVEMDEFVIMPNHFHGIVVMVGGRPACLPQYVGRTHRFAPTQDRPVVQNNDHK